MALASLLPIFLQVATPASLPHDTLRIRAVDHAPVAEGRIDSAVLGEPQVRVTTAQGIASIWLLRALDTAFVVARLPDATPAWNDALTVCIDVTGGGAAAPAHDDFQWTLRRTLDSSVVYRGRAGRWEPPRGDPDWRLGGERSGGGWEVASAGGAAAWTVVLRLDPAWLAGSAGRRPTLGFIVHDDDPNRWYGWPSMDASAGATLLERTPALWIPVK